ncbi:MAG: hypothetical protein K2X48_13835, partial [Chitinophagaceae bacterium]|nr:hypothetical protein [Chitinophagaceae bacterium]
MPRVFFTVFIAVAFTACRFLSDDTTKSENSLKGKAGYKLFLNPDSGSVYRFAVSNKTITETEVNGEQIMKENNSEMQ